jgi:DNA-binding NarL/FixJ family response regulator
MQRRFKVVLVEDHPVFREGLRQFIERDPCFEVVGEAVDGDSALALVLKVKADIALVDISLPGLDGLAVARQLQEHRAGVKVVILTMHKEEAILNAALNAGAMGFVLKENAATEILTCLKAVVIGEHHVTPAMSGFMVRRWDRTNRLAATKPGLEMLTTAERRVLKLIAQNKTSREIGKELFISHRTVEAHRANICTKLELRGIHPLLYFALEHQSEL